MISKLRGKLDSCYEDRVIIDVCGVGYLVYLSAKTIDNLKLIPREEEVTLITEYQLKEDRAELYGFIQEIEKTWFLELNKVQGVGAKLALKILSHFTIDDLAKVLISADTKSLCQVAGVGAKLAGRLASELKDSPKKIGVSININQNETYFNQNKIADNLIANDAVSALENLGYKKINCVQTVADLLKDNPTITLENLITKSLRELSIRRG